MSSKDKVLVIGSSNVDLNIYSKKFPIPGETVTGGRFIQSFGGKGANQAVASVRSGSKTVFIGKLGQDSFGNQMIENLNREGIDVHKVFRDPKHASGVAFILIDSSGQNMISVAPGANKKLTPQDIISCKDLIKSAKTIIMQMEISLEVIQAVIDCTQQKKIIKILNPAPFKPMTLDFVRQFDIITPNEHEIAQLHSSLALPPPKEDNFFKKLSTINTDLLEIGIQSIVITLGNKGCVVSTPNNNFSHIEAIKVKAVDTVGAGDCFNGVLASYLTKRKEIFEAAQIANIAASIAVTRKGAQLSMPFEAEIQKEFESLYNKTI